MAQFHLFTLRVGLVFFTQLILGLQSLILLPILTKNLSIENYGIWAQIMVTIGIIPNIVLFGLPYTMVRYIPALENKEELQETFYSIFSIVLLSATICSLALYLFSEEIADILFEENIIIANILAIIVWFECLIIFFINYFRAKQYIKMYSSIMLSKSILMILTVGYFIFNGYGIQGAVSGLLLIDIILFAILALLAYRDVGFKVPHFKNLKDYLDFGIPTVPGNLSSWVVNSSDRYVIGILLGASYVGYYSPGYSLGVMVRMFVSPLAFLLPTILSENYDKKQMNNVKLILTYSFKYFMIIAIPSVFGLSLLSKPLLTILSTPEIADKGYLITPFVAISMLLFGAFTILSQIIMLEKKTKIIGKIWMVAATLNLGLNFLLIPHIGIIGAALTTLIAFCFSVIITTIYSNRLLPFDVSLQPVIKSLFSSSIMSIPILIYEPTGLQNIFLIILFCAIIYFLLMNILNVFKEEEVSFIKSFSREFR
ncbi:flippase [Methanococcoides seepicolus]|uniref:Flippase n=1 Tax=Methanococcoides seepicolus TaxID=2828780 RepID=A0A9E5DBU8_9EURY|nr:flippase [Methanococcoides seepicolus]MCM1987222.1 flippase [Methanococcoides seepicolus]